MVISIFPFLVPQSSASKICAAVQLSPARRCTLLTNCPFLWPSSPISSLSPWPTVWTLSWCTGAPTQWPTVPPQVQAAAAAAAEAKPTVWNAQSPLGLHRVLQRTRRRLLRGTVRFHSEGVASIQPVLKVLLLQDVTEPLKSRESHQQSSPERDIAVNLICPVGTDLEGWMGCCSCCTCWCRLVDVRLPVLFTIEAHCDQVEQDFPGTNGCESRIITHRLTLQMSGGTLASFYLEIVNCI